MYSWLTTVAVLVISASSAFADQHSPRPIIFRSLIPSATPTKVDTPWVKVVAEEDTVGAGIGYLPAGIKDEYLYPRESTGTDGTTYVDSLRVYMVLESNLFDNQFRSWLPGARLLLHERVTEYLPGTWGVIGIATADRDTFVSYDESHDQSLADSRRGPEAEEVKRILRQFQETGGHYVRHFSFQSGDSEAEGKGNRLFLVAATRHTIWTPPEPLPGETKVIQKEPLLAALDLRLNAKYMLASTSDRSYDGMGLGLELFGDRLVAPYFATTRWLSSQEDRIWSAGAGIRLWSSLAEQDSAVVDSTEVAEEPFQRHWTLRLRVGYTDARFVPDVAANPSGYNSGSLYGPDAGLGLSFLVASWLDLFLSGQISQYQTDAPERAASSEFGYSFGAGAAIRFTPLVD